MHIEYKDTVIKTAEKFKETFGFDPVIKDNEFNIHETLVLFKKHAMPCMTDEGKIFVFESFPKLRDFALKTLIDLSQELGLYEND